MFQVFLLGTLEMVNYMVLRYDSCPICGFSFTQHHFSKGGIHKMMVFNLHVVIVIDSFCTGAT